MLNSHGQSFLNSFELPAGKHAVSKRSKKKRRLQESQEMESVKPDEKLEVQKLKASSPVPSASTSKAPDVVVFDARAGTSSQLLHELVHSQLLSNPHTFDAKQGSARRSRMVAGRLLELADDAKIGRGAEGLKAKENSHHAKRVRLGLLDKAREREAKALEEAKALGNYHPSIKKNFDALSSGGEKRRRERGLALGIGKFRNGALTMSKSDIRSVEGAVPSAGSRKGKGVKRH
ncbi:hypothetical protein RSAG8_06101, partial [Rhizoctonia solani AG-8 WAC10335]